MKFIIFTHGCSGDINSFIYIALELKKRKYDVVFLTNEYYKGVVESYGIDFYPVSTIKNYLDGGIHPHGKRMKNPLK